jgi:hypothetical protein
MSVLVMVLWPLSVVIVALAAYALGKRASKPKPSWVQESNELATHVRRYGIEQFLSELSVKKNIVITTREDGRDVAVLWIKIVDGAVVHCMGRYNDLMIGNRPTDDWSKYWYFQCGITAFTELSAQTYRTNNTFRTVIKIANYFAGRNVKGPIRMSTLLYFEEGDTLVSGMKNPDYVPLSGHRVY